MSGRGIPVGVDISVGAAVRARAVVGEGRESVSRDGSEVGLDGALAGGGVGAEPGVVAGSASRDTSEVVLGVEGVGLGSRSSGDEGGLASGGAADVGGAPLEGGSRPNLGKTALDRGTVDLVDACAEARDLAVGSNDLEEAGRLDLVGVDTGGGQVVGRAHC